jgi:hypothetical protein
LEELAFIGEVHRFFSAGYPGIILLDQGQEGLEEGLSFLKDILAGADELLVIDVQEAFVGTLSLGEGFQEAVPLLEDLIVFDEALQVAAVQLGKEGIEESSALLTAAGDDLYVIGGDDNAGKAADMVGELLIGLVVQGKFLLAVLTQDAKYLVGLALLLKMPLDTEAGVAFTDILLVGFGEIALGEAEVIDRIEQVGLADAIIATNADDPVLELEGGLGIILELDERYLFE